MLAVLLSLWSGVARVRRSLPRPVEPSEGLERRRSGRSVSNALRPLWQSFLAALGVAAASPVAAFEELNAEESLTVDLRLGAASLPWQT